MGMATSHCIAFFNPKCALNDAKQMKRVGVDFALNGKQNSVVYNIMVQQQSRGLHVASKGGPDAATTNSLGGPLVLP